jgi:hypothetical protein
VNKVADQGEAYLRIENLSKIYATRDVEVGSLSNISFTQARGRKD